MRDVQFGQVLFIDSPIAAVPCRNEMNESRHYWCHHCFSVLTTDRHLTISPLDNTTR